MAISSYIENDTVQVCALNNYCSGLTGTIEAGRQAEGGVSAGSSEQTFTVGAGVSDAPEFSFEVILAADTTSDADTATIPINFTTGAMNATLESVHICRVNSSCVNQETIGSSSGLGLPTNAGIQSPTVSCSAVTFAAGDKVLIILGFSESGGHSGQTVGITPDQTMTLPFIPPAPPAVDFPQSTLAQLGAGI